MSWSEWRLPVAIVAGVITGGIAGLLAVTAGIRIGKRHNRCQTAGPTKIGELDPQVEIDIRAQEHYQYHVEEFQRAFDLKICQLEDESKKPCIVHANHANHPINVVNGSYFLSDKKQLELLFFLQRCANQPDQFIQQRDSRPELAQALGSLLPFDIQIQAIILSYHLERKLQKIYLRPLSLANTFSLMFTHGNQTAVIETTNEIFEMVHYPRRFDQFFDILHQSCPMLVEGSPFIGSPSLERIGEYLKQNITKISSMNCIACTENF